jgi:hypothetical protein
MLVAVLCSAGCSSAADVTLPGSASVSASATAIEVTSTTQLEIPTTTEFFDTNGTDPNPELSEPHPASWVLDPAVAVGAESTSLQLIVTEQQCASGISPTGRIEATVSYTETEVEVSVIVNSVGGTANCPGNPPTPFTLELTEPLGDRLIVCEAPHP